MRLQLALHSTPEARERTLEGVPNRARASASIPRPIFRPPTARSPWMTNGGVAASPGTANRQAASTAITTKRMRNRLIQRGQRILVYGASGTSAPPGVQLAKHFEAH